MTGQQLKNSILQLAIQGRLVAQDPADEPASVLLQRIRQEKQRLVKEGKLKKKDLTSTPITDEEKPFDIPETWEWCRLGEIVKNRDAERVPLSVSVRHQQKNRIYDYYGPGGAFDKVDNYLFDKRMLLIGEDGANLLTRSKPNAFFAEGKYWVNNHVHVLDSYIEDDIILDYIAMRINGMSLADYVTGTAQPKMNQEKMNSIPIPLPPLSEQRRIVARIEELMPLVEAYGKAQEELEALNAGLPEALKKSILQEAIQGRLVPQDPNDEPASVLLVRIRKEKEQLVKAGKLKKKDLTSTPITEEEKPFDIPETWEWCRLGEILSPMETKKPQGDFFDYIDIDAVDNKKQIVGHPKHLAVSEAPSRASRKLHSGDVIYSMVRPYLRNIAIINEEHKDCIASTGFYVCSPFEGLSTKYLYRFLLSPYFTDGMHLLMKGDNSPSINAADLQGYLIPLPPLSEQRRIVAKIESLFAAIDQMKALH